MIDEKNNKAIIDNNNNDYHSQYFHYYSSLDGKNNSSSNRDINRGFSAIVPVTQQQVGYQAGIVENRLVSNNNYSSSTNTYKPLLSTTQYDQRYTTLSRQPEQ